MGRRLAALLTATLAVGACAVPAGAAERDPELPAPVQVRPEPQGVGLADPSFAPAPGARAEFGRLGGAVYQIEIPDRWNRQLVLYIHGYESLAAEASATAPDLRRYLLGQGFAWGSSSFSSTSWIPGRAADETAALWDHFARTYGKPTRSYVTGLSMGGAGTHFAAERYPDRFDGALAMCGSAGYMPSTMSPSGDFFVAGAYLAGITQEEYDAAAGVGDLIHDRILPALEDPATHARFEDLIVDFTGGPRAYAREGVHAEEQTNWERAELSLNLGLAASRPDYRLRSGQRAFDRSRIRLRPDAGARRGYIEGSDTTGRLRMPMMTLHATGDGQVPIDQALILRRRVQRAGRARMLRQRVFRDPGHCGFTTAEQEEAFADLRRWVERGTRPRATDLGVRDLRRLDPTFERAPRPGTRAASRVTGARDRVRVEGRLTRDGAPVDAEFLGAVVIGADGLVTPCQYTLPEVADGAYRVGVFAGSEASGCGRRGSRVALWIFADDQELFSQTSVAWPGDGRTTRFDTTFSSGAPRGVVPPTFGFAAEVFRRNGRRLPPGTRVEAFIGRTRCGQASVRRSGSYTGISMAVVGPDSVPACREGATIRFLIGGRPAVETAVNEPGQDDRDLVALTVR